MIATREQIGQSLRRQQSALAQAVVAHRFARPAEPAGLWQQIGADGHARDAECATALGRAVTATGQR